MKVYRFKKFDWLKDTAGKQELGCTKMLIYAMCIVNMFWLLKTLTKQYPDASKEFVQKVLIGMIIFFRDSFGDRPIIYIGSIIILILPFFLSLIIYTKWRQDRRLKSKTHLNTYSVALITYCQYKFAANRCPEIPLSLFNFIVNYLLFAVIVFSIFPTKWMNDILVYGFFLSGLFFLLPLPITLPILIIFIFKFINDNKEIFLNEFIWLNKTNSADAKKPRG